MTANRRVLIVDDNRAIHEDFRKILQRRAHSDVETIEAELFGIPPPSPAVAFELSSAYQGADGVELVRAAHAAGEPFALALVDMRMPPGIDGLQTVARMWEADPDLQIVICTAYSDASWQDIVQRFGPTDRLLILKKPFDLAEVCQLTLALTEKWNLGREARLRVAELAASRGELSASLALAQAVQEATADGLLVVGTDRKVTMANRRFLELWSISPVVLATGDDVRMLGSVIDQVADAGAMLERVNYFYDHPDESGNDEVRLKDGRVFERWTSPVRSETHVHGRLWWFRDVTERRRYELDRAVVIERMAAMGRLAAGVGHEINNPLTYVLANIESLLDSSNVERPMPPAREIVERLEEAREGLGRIRVIVRDLQHLARSDEAHGEVDLRQVIEQSIQIAAAELRHRAPIVRRYEQVPNIRGSRTRLGQVFLNLIINAAQAIPDGQSTHHQIEIVIRRSGLDCVVEVRDTGSGIAAEHLEQIFDPFFTTKEVGAGTGLGLSISREIVSSHGGTLTVKSVPGAGTTMRVTLPHAEAVAQLVVPVAASAAPSGRRAKVLVIDDEPLITRILQKGLARHDVVVASQAKDALARIEQGEAFDVILCDLMMPDVSGIDVHEHLTRTHPEIAMRMVFMTGGAFTSKAKLFLATVPNERIDKPFSIAQIKQLVERHLDAA
jgi:signal transduction histidine kinase/DNA-binding NarL/FixJ family response regulator